MDHIKEELLKNFRAEPENIQRFILSDSLEKKISLIARKFNLNEENEAKLADRVVLSIIGIIKEEDMIMAFSETLDAETNLIPSIVKSVNEEIIRPLKEGGEVEISNLPIKQENQFLPQLVRKIDNSQQTLDNRPSDIKEEGGKPEVTSALAAEIGGLLSKTNNQRPTTNNLQPEVQKLTTNNEQRTTEENREKLATTMPKPEDKLTGVVQVPRVEVEMVKREATKEKPVDPYREEV